MHRHRILFGVLIYANNVSKICVREWYSPYVMTKSLLKWSFGKKTLKCQKFQMNRICATSICLNLKPKMRVIVIFSRDWKCNQKQTELLNWRRWVGIEIECDHLYYLFNRAFFVPSFIVGFTNNQNPFQPVQSKKQCIYYKKIFLFLVFFSYFARIFFGKMSNFVSQSKYLAALYCAIFTNTF